MSGHLKNVHWVTRLGERKTTAVWTNINTLDLQEKKYSKSYNITIL